jgi:DMSO/TMAO reductase YedYZ molybdopterin-dependent catalytic subunit
MSAQAAPHPVSQRARAYGRAGALAALLALFLDLLWRALAAPAGVPSLPESVVAAVARLTPTSLFGWATENFGSTAQNSLWALVLLGIVGAGYWVGQVAGAFIDASGSGQSSARRGLVAVVMAAMLFLVVTVIILPIAREGLFGASSPHQALLLAQAALLAGGWALAWLALSSTSAAAPSVAVQATDQEPVTRRLALRGVAAAGLTAGIAVLGWRLARTPNAGNALEQEQTAADIAARARESATGEGKSVFAAQASTPEPVVASTDANPEAIFAELEAEGKLTPVITSVADFYHVSKNISDPVVDGSGWTLTISGLVETPLSLTYDDIMARVNTTNITTLSCISNELNGDLAGTAEWSGLPLRELLEEAGINPATVDVVFHAADGYDDSIPFAQAMAPTTMLVTGMNGEPLPPDHGFPARLIVPPIYGMKNVKWVERIEAVDVDYQGYWQTRGWSDPAPYQIWGRIDTPAAGDRLEVGPAVAAGVAAAGDRGILRVEISLDGGTTWGDADLEPSINPNFTWVRWSFPFDAAQGDLSLLMRATDGEGTVAPNEYQPPLPDGATGWPERTVRVG